MRPEETLVSHITSTAIYLVFPRHFSYHVSDPAQVLLSPKEPWNFLSHPLIHQILIVVPWGVIRVVAAQNCPLDVFSKL